MDSDVLALPSPPLLAPVHSANPVADAAVTAALRIYRRLTEEYPKPDSYGHPMPRINNPLHPFDRETLDDTKDNAPLSSFRTALRRISMVSFPWLSRDDKMLSHD